MKLKYNRKSFTTAKTNSQRQPEPGTMSMSTNQQRAQSSDLGTRGLTRDDTTPSRRSVRCRSKFTMGKKSGIRKMNQAAATTGTGSRGSSSVETASRTTSGASHSHSKTALTMQGNTASPGPEEVSKMSTFELLSDPSLMTAGLQLLSQMGDATDVKVAASIGRRLGIIGRSPPITASDRVLRRVKEHNENQLPGTEKRRKGTGDPGDDGVVLVKELFRRSRNNATAIQVQVSADNFDLPTPAVDDVRVQEEFTDRILPGYKAKATLVKEHFKNIEAMNVNKMIQHYNSVKPELKEIFEVGSPRTDLLVQGGKRGRRMLIDMSVSVPFSNEQSSALIQILFDYFVPNLTERRRYADYITLVMLPEALIRIYANVNQVSNELAEKELRFRAYYQGDGENLNESITSTP